jgi:hypothetical protein
MVFSPVVERKKLGPGSAMMAALMRTSCAGRSTGASPLRSSSHARKFDPSQPGSPFLKSGLPPTTTRPVNPPIEKPSLDERANLHSAFRHGLNESAISRGEM